MDDSSGLRRLCLGSIRDGFESTMLLPLQIVTVSWAELMQMLGDSSLCAVQDETVIEDILS